MPVDVKSAPGGSLQPPRVAVLLLVALPMLLNAIALFHEVRYATPGDNDQIFHYLFIERANQAVAAGDNPFDHWLPELEAGFPQFLFYQNLPHLTVVALHHLVLERVSLLTILNVVRYLLMVLFPLTVFWSMRRMDFSLIAAAVGAAFSTTLSSSLKYGFDYHSYIWNGHGMFPQLCSMHLVFIAAACLYQVFERNRGYAGAIIASSAVVLSDLLYGYIFAIAALILWLASVFRQIAKATDARDSIARVSRLTARFVIVGSVAAVLTAYQTLPFLMQVQFINRQGAGGLERYNVGISGVLSGFFGGHLFDNHRLPIVTVLVVLGIAYGLVKRRDDAKIALSFFVTFLIIGFGREIFGRFYNFLPLAHILPAQRLLAGGDFGAILLAGLGGELIWNRWPWDFMRTRTIAPIALLLIMCSIALAERWTFYAPAARDMEASAEALQNDLDLAQIISTLKASPPGRVYAGSRGNWGMWMNVGKVYLYDLLPIEMFATVMPWQSLSLNSPFLWRLNIPDDNLCRLFNIRYVVAPPTIRVPRSYRRILVTPRYVLYQIDSGGYVELGQLGQVLPMPSNSGLFSRNSDWIASTAPAQANFIAYLSKRQLQRGGIAPVVDSGLSDKGGSPRGTVEDEAVTPDAISAQVTANSAALLVFKTTYHPNWHVIVDGHEQHAFMVSPSFIGTLITPGPHQVKAVYRSSKLKKLLLIVTCLTLIVILAIRILALEQRLFGRLSNPV